MAMASLREALGAKVPEPTGAVVVRWAGDPFARGYYSHVAVGARAADMDALAAPEGERLYFCGEATMRGYSATVHGAYLSGLREAARIGGSTPPGVKTTRRRSRRRAGVQLSRKRRT
jgi:monoamine oxidase